MSTRDVVLAEFASVAQEHKKPLAALTDALPLLETGLDSLCFAVIVARLEDTLGTDPFSGDGDGEIPMTVGDFVRLYESAR